VLVFDGEIYTACPGKNEPPKHFVVASEKLHGIENS